MFPKVLQINEPSQPDAVSCEDTRTQKLWYSKQGMVDDEISVTQMSVEQSCFVYVSNSDGNCECWCHLLLWNNIYCGDGDETQSQVSTLLLSHFLCPFFLGVGGNHIHASEYVHVCVSMHLCESRALLPYRWSYSFFSVFSPPLMCRVFNLELCWYKAGTVYSWVSSLAPNSELFFSQ